MLRVGWLAAQRVRRRCPLVARCSTRAGDGPSALDAAYRLVLGVDAAAKIRIAPEQAGAVASALDGFSVFLHLPTGAGKSLAFQVPALLAPAEATTLVLSPLIALMHDQVANLKRKGVDAIHVSAETVRPTQRRRALLQELLANRRLVYTTPEFLLQNREMQEWVLALRDRRGLSRIVLDEAHCVLEWGNSFRPSYLELCRWKARHFREVPVTLVTATVLEDDIPRLAELFHTQLVSSKDGHANSGNDSLERATQMRLFQHISDRPNLRIEVVRKSSAQTPALIQSRVGNSTAIVYCLTRREADELCLELIRLGCRAGVYHGGIPHKRREFVRKQWMGGQISLICATSAFGMGIDRADVRFVIHHSLPLSLASYYQQIGRAGRDGEPAACLLMFAAEDKTRAHWISTERIDEHDGTSLSSGASHVDVEEVASFCETTGCRRAFIATHFGHAAVEPCKRNCNCGPLEELPVLYWREGMGGNETVEEKRSSTPSHDHDDLELEPAVTTIEYYYHKVLAEARKQNLPKREALSRRAIREILRAEPSTIEEMAELRGVGQEKAERFFYTFSFR